MALIKQNLYNDLLNMENGAHPGETIAQAIIDYAKPLTPPTTTHPPASSTFFQACRPLTPPGTFVTGFPPVLAAYTAALSGGILPASGGVLTGIPPVPIIFIADIFLTPQSRETFARRFSNRVHAYFKRGKAVNNASGATIPWS